MKCTLKFVFTCALLAVLVLPLNAKKDSDPSAPSKKEKKADLNAFAQKYGKAEELYFTVLDENGSDAKVSNRVNLKLADIYYSTRRYNKAEEYYEKTIHSPLSYTTRDLCNFIDVLVRANKFRRAEEVSRLYLDVPPYSDDVRFKNQQKGLNGLIKYMLSDSSQYTVRVAPFSSSASDFWCTPFGDDILFIRSDQYGEVGGEEIEASDRKISKAAERNLIKGAQYYIYDGQSVKPFDKASVTLQAGPASISEDGSFMIYTDNRYGNRLPRKVKPGEVITNALCLMELTYNSKSEKWVKPVILFKDREDVSYCHPALSPDGKYLFFSSNMPGGYGGMDIYVVERLGKNKWGNPINLGPEVNTSGDEVYALLYGERLLFSSNGHIGLGGQDTYFAKLDGNNMPVKGSLRHMPYPINTSSNDYALMFADNKEGYVSSDRPGTMGLDDIYRFVRNTVGLEGFGDLDIATGDFISTLDGRPITEEDQRNMGMGKGSLPIPAKQVQEEGSKLVTGESEADMQVLFAYNDSNLSKDALKAIDKFVEKHGFVDASILVLGYADETGRAEYNQMLSQKRAESVKNYLISKGYPASGITATGKGQIKLAPDEQAKANSRIGKLAPARKADIKFVTVNVDE